MSLAPSRFGMIFDPFPTNHQLSTTLHAPWGVLYLATMLHRMLIGAHLQSDVVSKMGL